MIIASLAKKFRNLLLAILALGHLWKHELSFRIQLLCAAITLALAATLHLSPVEWLFIVSAIGAVFTVEAINTAIEELCDAITTEHHVGIGTIKDLGALAAALTGLTALIIGLVIFLPKLLAFV